MNKIYEIITKGKLGYLNRGIKYFQSKVLEYTGIITNPPNVLNNRMKNAVTIRDDYLKRLNQLSNKKKRLEAILKNAS